MIEDNYINQDFTLRNPVKAIKDISYDTTCKRKLRLDNGREYSPIEIQREYCEMAQKYIEQYPVSDELRDAVAKWQYVLDCLDDDPDRLDREIDWVIKRQHDPVLHRCAGTRPGTIRASSCSTSSTTTSA